MGRPAFLLHFGAVDWEATVWVNGKKLGKHQGGYDGFSYDITDVTDRRTDRRNSSSASGTPPTPARSRAASRSQARRHLLHASHRHLADRLARTRARASIDALKIMPDVDNEALKLTVKPTRLTRRRPSVDRARAAEGGSVRGKRARQERGAFDCRFTDAELWSPE